MPESSLIAASTVFFTAAAVALWSVCAPPAGSGITPSITFSSFSEDEVILSAAAASGAFAPSRQRMEAQPSGEMTE